MNATAFSSASASLLEAMEVLAAGKAKRIEELEEEIERLKKALTPFADVADLVEHTDKRDGERVMVGRPRSTQGEQRCRMIL